MATSTFDRQLVLTEQGIDNLIALKKKWEKDPPPIEPISEDSLKVADALLQHLFDSNN